MERNPQFRSQKLILRQARRVVDLKCARLSIPAGWRGQLIQRKLLPRSEDALPALHQTRVLRNPEHPWPDSLRFPKLRKALENSQQRLLGDLLGVFALPAH